LKNEKLYPSYVILDKASDWTYKLKGYKTPGELLPLLNFYGEGSYLKMSWSEFTASNK
jgi:thioredoxin-related protein